MRPIMGLSCQLARPLGFGLGLAAFVAAGCVVGCSGSIQGPSGGSGKAAGNAGGSPSAGGPGPGAHDPGGVPSAPATGQVPAGVRRLSQAQYRATIAGLLGPSIQLPKELDRDDPDSVLSSVGGYRVATTSAGVVKYDSAAYDIAHQVFADPKGVNAVLGCDPKQGAVCAQSFLRGFGRRAWRRPLSDDEVARYAKVIDEVGQTLGSAEIGFEYALAGILQSPNFLYVAELGENEGGRLRFTNHEMATRLSYLLGGSLPDTELSAAADKGDLVTPQGLQAQIDRLLGSETTRPSLLGFFSELFALNDLDDVAKDATVYPSAAPGLFAAMREEVERLVGDTVLDRRNVMLDLFDVNRAFVNPELAKHYGLAAPAGPGFGSVTLPPASERAGVLTTGAWLSIMAKPYASSPTLRGVFLREKILCQDVPPPPANVDNQLPNPTEQKTAVTTRQVLEQHRKDPACATCHAFFDPLGVAFEHFDGVGAHRASENGLAIDTSGELDGKRYGALAEMLALLKADPRVAECMIRHSFHYVSGHQGLPNEEALVGRLAQAFRGKPDFRDLLDQMLNSDWFRYPGAPL